MTTCRFCARHIHRPEATACSERGGRMCEPGQPAPGPGTPPEAPGRPGRRVKGRERRLGAATAPQSASWRVAAGARKDPAPVAQPVCTTNVCAGVVKVTIPGMRLENPLNRRQHWRTVSRRGKAEKDRTRWVLMSAARPRGAPTAEQPWTVTVTRCGPGMLDRHDALPASAKHVVDAVAEWIGVDDKRHDLVRYVYDQRRAKEWSVEIVVEVRRG